MMSIISLGFIAFVIGSITLFAVFPKKIRWISLLVSSVTFYIISDLRCFGFVVFSSFSVWCAAKYLDKKQKEEKTELEKSGADQISKKKIKTTYRKRRRLILLICLFVNVGILVSLKICKFLNISVIGMLTGGEQDEMLSILMPLGISYYTFSVVGYLLDVYWKRYACEQNYFRFFTWTIYFPHIIQGPISRYDQLGKELRKELSLTWINFKFGLELILWGLFKKLVIAERVSIFTGTVYGDDKLMEVGIISLLALILDAVQIYADFSGYVDIVTGISEIFGVKLEKNFNHPFLSRTVPEFWRRWHMSLGSWFKDYVYYPISVSGFCKRISKYFKKKGYGRTGSVLVTVIPVMCTWILTGLWHGTGMGYLAWGIYYGTLITLSIVFAEKITYMWKKLSVRTESFSFRLFQHIKIFCIFMGGRFLGNTLGMQTRILIVKNIIGDLLKGRIWSSQIYTCGLDAFNFVIVIMGIVILIVVSLLQEKMSIRKAFESQNFVFKLIILCCAFYAVFIFGVWGAEYDVGSFMYQQF